MFTAVESFVDKMYEWREGGFLDYIPENVLIDIFSYLTTRELVRAGR